MTVIQKRYLSRGDRGIALLLTLGILLLLTLLALSFSSSQLTENQAARNFNQGAKADEIALGGLEAAIAVLREDSRDNSYDHLFERWAIYYEDDDGFADVFNNHDEHDADLSDYDELEYRVDETANIRSPRKDPWKDRPRPDSRWIKVMERDPGTGQERLAGRYAVCIEDENAKVNINTAGNPDPVYTSGYWRHRRNMGFTTAEIDLGAVFQTLGEVFRDTLADVDDYPYNADVRTALDIVRYRNGYDGHAIDDQHNTVPGTVRDDNSTSQMPLHLRQDRNGIDDDGDRFIDEEGEEIDEPGEFEPYDPMEIGAPGELFFDATPSAGTTGVMGNDTPYLSVPHVKMAFKTVTTTDRGSTMRFSIMEDDQLKPPYPKDRLYRSLLPYVTVYSQDLNRVSEQDLYPRGRRRGSVEWAMRENIGRWWDRGPSEVKQSLDWLKAQGIAFTSASDDTLKQIAVNIYDFIDADWLPTRYGDLVGIEATAYLNEVEPSPPPVPGAQVGIEGFIEDYGECIELWNPYEVPLDIRNYYVSIDGGSPKRIGDMAVVPRIRPGGFFVIGDTLGDVVNVGQGTRQDQTLPPYPPGCQAYGPLKISPNQDMTLEIRIGRRGALVEKSRLSGPAGQDNITAQKDDPRVPEWRQGAGTLRSMNLGMTNRDNVYSYFYIPGVRSRAGDQNYNPSDPAILEHAGALSSVGELGMVHRGKQWESLNFTGKDLNELRDREDAALLDFLTLPYPYVHEGLKNDPELRRDKDLPPPKVVPGRINVNTASPEVLMGLNWDGMIEDLRSYNVRVSPALRFAIIQHIIERRRQDPYRNLADVAGDFAEFMEKRAGLASAPEAAKEAFLRYNANLITTKSNVFKVTVVAEVFDRRGNIAASRKLEAVVDRGFTPGSLGRNNEPNPTREDQTRAEAARTLYFKWVTESR